MADAMCAMPICNVRHIFLLLSVLFSSLLFIIGVKVQLFASALLLRLQPSVASEPSARANGNINLTLATSAFAAREAERKISLAAAARFFRRRALRNKRNISARPIILQRFERFPFRKFRNVGRKWHSLRTNESAARAKATTTALRHLCFHFALAFRAIRTHTRCPSYRTRNAMERNQS